MKLSEENKALIRERVRRLLNARRKLHMTGTEQAKLEFSNEVLGLVSGFLILAPDELWETLLEVADGKRDLQELFE